MESLDSVLVFIQSSVLVLFCVLKYHIKIKFLARALSS